MWVVWTTDEHVAHQKKRPAGSLHAGRFLILGAWAAAANRCKAPPGTDAFRKATWGRTHLPCSGAT